MTVSALSANSESGIA
ncbi:hypothetical protein Tco_0483027, partial [Tanacetum coccineum]